MTLIQLIVNTGLASFRDRVYACPWAQRSPALNPAESISSKSHVVEYCGFEQLQVSKRATVATTGDRVREDLDGSPVVPHQSRDRDDDSR